MEPEERFDESITQSELEPLNVPGLKAVLNKNNVEIGEETHRVVLDDILANEVGQFGLFQFTTIFLAAFPIIFSAFAASEYIFTTARINTRCRISECDDGDPKFAPSWILNAIPGTSPTSFDNCERYASAQSPPVIVEGMCPAVLFNHSMKQPCEAYVYENQYSAAYDFNMACKEWQRALMGLSRTIGSLFSLPVTGYISDRWGRRVALVISSFNMAWVGFVRSFTNSYETFVAFEFLEDFLGSGAFTCCYILVLELAGPKYRVLAGGIVDSIYGLGLVIVGFIAWVVPVWRPLTRVLYTPQFLVVSYFWIMSESVRWLMSKGRYEESEQILKKIARVNKKELSDQSLRALRITDEAEKEMPRVEEPWLPTLVFQSTTILYRCLVCPLLWVTNMLVYYGMTVSAINLVGNGNLNYIAVAAIEVPGIWTAILLLDRIGRKPTIMCGYWLCAMCQFAFAFLPEEYDSVRPALYILGKYFITTVTSSVYVYTAELFPTKHRHTLFAFSSTIGRLGYIIAPLIPALALTVWKCLPQVAFGTCAILSSTLLFKMPETRGTKLPDTFEDAEQLGIKNK